MKILLEKITFSNFRSYGNQPTTVTFENGVDLAVGINGQGKTTAFVHSLVYAFYGVGVYGENLGDLCNRINDAPMFVEVSLFKGDNKFSIKRGRPKILEVRKDGEVLSFFNDKNANEYIQDVILEGLTLSSFNSLFAVQTNNPAFSVFKMSKPERRAMIEQLFDLSEFKEINAICKKELEEIRAEYGSLNEDKGKKASLLNVMLEKNKEFTLANKEYEENRVKEIENLEKEIEALNFKKYTPEAAASLSKLQKEREEALKAIELELKLRDQNAKRKEQLEKDLNKANEELAKLDSTLDYSKLIADTEKAKDELIAKRANAIGKSSALSAIKDSIVELSAPCNRKCPVETFIVSMEEVAKDENLEKEIEALTKKVAELKRDERNLAILKQNIERISKDIANLPKNNENIDVSQKVKIENDYFKDKALNEDISVTMSLLNTKTKAIDLLKKQPKPVLPFNPEDFKKMDLDYKDIDAKLKKLGSRGKALAELHEFLKKDFIRNFMVKNAFPPLKASINKILGTFFKENVKVTFDNDLEPIIHRGGVETSYSSFSGGEKKRLDLAFLFAIREFLLTKSAISMNILVMDELLDSELDDDGVRVVFEYLNSLDGTNVILITHKLKNYESRRIYEIAKEKKFSKLSVRLAM